MAAMTELKGPSLAPAEGKPEQLVMFLHGVGADGNDLIGLAPYFQKVAPRALFVAPNAPFPFDMAAFGFQWFSLNDFSLTARLRGVRSAAPMLDAFIDSQLGTLGLREDKLVLIGFSQGTMMALHVGLRRATAPAGIIGYSGMLVGPETLAAEIRSRPPVLLVHGDADAVLPVEALPAATAALEAAGVPVQSHVRPGLGHSIDEPGLLLGMSFLAESIGASLDQKGDLKHA
ncbi:MAG: phospholipase [Rhodospirillales bacterium]|nr:phospholipase [Rhodospirillales bacterium]